MASTKRTPAAKSRRYLLPIEIDRLLAEALKEGTYAHRNFTMLLLCYRHGLRLKEIIDLRWSMVDLKNKTLRVVRIGGKKKSAHPLRPDEVKALRELKDDFPSTAHVFISRFGSRLSERSVSRIFAQLGRAAKIQPRVAPSVLRRSAGRALVHAGHNLLAIQKYLGHRDISQVLDYLELPANPYKGFWAK